MSIKSFFKLLIILDLTLSWIGFAIRKGLERHAPDNLRELFSWSGFGGLHPAGFHNLPLWGAWIWFLLVGVLFAASFIAPAGMYFFLRWARSIFMILTIIQILQISLAGIFIAFPLENMFYVGWSTVNGLLLGIAYFSPLANEFNRPQKRTV